MAYVTRMCLKPSNIAYNAKFISLLNIYTSFQERSIRIERSWSYGHIGPYLAQNMLNILQQIILCFFILCTCGDSNCKTELICGRFCAGRNLRLTNQQLRLSLSPHASAHCIAFVHLDFAAS